MRLHTARTAAAVTATLLSATLLSAGVPAAQAATAAPLSGPDVSGWQHPNGAPIDWVKVKAAGNAFAIVKATEGAGYTNPYYASDISRARAAHLVVGGYAYVRPALPISTAVTQARHLTDVLGPVTSAGTLPPILDLEETGGLSPADLITWTQTFLETVRATTGRTPMLYSYPYFWPSALASTTAFGRYPLWLASYRATPPAPLAGWSQWTLWQYTSSEPVPGIPGSAIDRSHFAGTAAQLAALANGTVRTSWPVTVASPPSGVSASAAVQAATVRWLPGNDGGSVASSYEVTASPGGLTRTVSGTSSSVLFTGLHAGTPYAFTVRTANRAGWSASSAPTAAVVPGQVPSVPTQLAAGTPASGQVALHWTAAAGAPTSYRVYRCAVLPSPAPLCVPGGAPVGVVSASSTTFTDTGRTNQDSYRYAVDAVNRWGSSPRSTVVSATPVGPPPAPTALTATTSGSSVLLTWSPPVRTGGADLTQYVVTTDAAAPVILPATARAYTATDLTAAAHTFSVAARSPLGLGAAARVQASLLVPPAPQVQPVTAAPVVVTVSHPAPALPGAAVTLTVRVVRADTRTPLAALPVTVTVVPRAGARPAPLHVLTNATGTATVIVRPAVTSAVTALVTASSSVRAGAASYLLPVRGSLTARLAATTVRVAQPTAVSGITGGLLVGERVRRQQYYAGSWHTLATAPVTSTGAWRFVFTPTTVGPHLYRVVLPASWLHLAVASPTLVLGVTR